jgi:hypothetical protein
MISSHQAGMARMSAIFRGKRQRLTQSGYSDFQKADL